MSNTTTAARKERVDRLRKALKAAEAERRRAAEKVTSIKRELEDAEELLRLSEQLDATRPGITAESAVDVRPAQPGATSQRPVQNTPQQPVPGQQRAQFQTGPQGMPNGAAY